MVNLDLAFLVWKGMEKFVTFWFQVEPFCEVQFQKYGMYRVESCVKCKQKALIINLQDFWRSDTSLVAKAIIASHLSHNSIIRGTIFFTCAKFWLGFRSATLHVHWANLAFLVLWARQWRHMVLLAQKLDCLFAEMYTSSPKLSLRLSIFYIVDTSRDYSTLYNNTAVAMHPPQQWAAIVIHFVQLLNIHCL